MFGKIPNVAVPRLSALSLAVSALCAVSLMAASMTAEAAGQKTPLAVKGEFVGAPTAAAPGTTAKFGCETRAFAGTRLFCYEPASIRAAYGLNKLISHGITGKGATIVIIDAFGNPTVAADLEKFDTTFGIAKADFEVVNLNPKPFDLTDANQVGWAEEIALDVQYSHAIAPGAKIVLITAASNGDDDLRAAAEYAIAHYPGAIISESFGESEYDLATDPTGQGQAVLAADEATYASARANGNTVFVSAGDSGTSESGLAAPEALYPASSPNVTSVGGTNLWFGKAGAADPNGKYITETVWNDGYGAGGGGVSIVFPSPAYQNSLPASTKSVLAGKRGYPDVAYNAGVVGGVLVNLGFLGANSGFYIFGGTSAGAPQWAGVAALATQLKGSPLGFINPQLYRFGAAAESLGIQRDITAGQNGYNSVLGYPAGPSWDLSTGWGTPTGELVEALSLGF